ncbi:MAG: HEAT repeat domain-containing protein, partial [Myxococcota bacterium]
ECDEAIDCWVGKLGDSEMEIARKAAYMLGRFGRDNEAAITALVEHLGHSQVEVRLAVVTALDRIATNGSDAAVAKISELEESEAGSGIWNTFAREALPIQSRLRNRSS